MKLQDVVREDSNLVYLEDLNRRKVSERDIDIRGYEVISESGNKIGEVTDLVLDSKENEVRYIEIKNHTSDTNINVDLLQKSKSPIPPEKGMDKSDNNYQLIPVGVVKVKPTSKCVELDDIVADTLNSVPTQFRKNPVTADYETSILKAYEEHSPVSLDGKFGERMFDKGLIKGRGQYANKFFANHYFTNRD